VTAFDRGTDSVALTNRFGKAFGRLADAGCNGLCQVTAEAGFELAR
jgi:hypothetical protein